jgi:regulator of RNase E activity RraA
VAAVPARPHTLSPRAVEKLRRVSTATLTSQLLTRGLRNTFLLGPRPTRPDLRMVGYAFTLRYVPAREDLGAGVEYDNETDVQRLAVEAVGPDDVLVVDARGDTRAASLGHILATRLRARGAAGLVTDGALRDAPAFAGLDLPSYAAGSHATTSAVLHRAADTNVLVGCGGVLVAPGDVMVGDAEGVVAIPAHLAEEVSHDAAEQERLEAWILGKVAAGSSIRGVYPPDERTRAEYERERGG